MFRNKVINFEQKYVIGLNTYTSLKFKRHNENGGLRLEII